MFDKIQLRNNEKLLIGTIFSASDNSPDVNHFYFIVDKDVPSNRINQSKFCFTFSLEGMIIGRIEAIFVSNQYFDNPQTIKNFDNGPFGLQNFFPSDKWEDFIGLVEILGIYPYKKEYNDKENFNSYRIEEKEILNKIRRCTFPVRPGEKLYILEGKRLMDFIGIEEKGIHLGNLENYKIQAKININRLLNKHFAVLAMSGAGKSYLISVILEELLERNKEVGTPNIILFDVHGEYKFLSDPSIYENRNFLIKTEYIDAKYIEIPVKKLSAYDIANYQPKISRAQIRELKKIIEILKKNKNEIEKDKNNKESNSNEIEYDLNDVIDLIENEDQMNPKTKNALIGWLYELSRLNVFSKNENPQIERIIKPGRLIHIDFSNILSIKKKQIIASYLLNKLFYFRRNNQIPPFLAILEEAHQFAPEGDLHDSGITKHIIETIAREGRKFFAQLCLISQRPVKLSTTALSQCNTHIILRITNPNDLEHIRASSEALTKNNLKAITTLPTGTALIMGSATNIPIFVEVRERNSKDPETEISMEDLCKTYN